MAENNEPNLILVNEDYSENKELKSVRVPAKLYNDFAKATPFGVAFSPMMVNLMIHFIHNREEVLDFLNKLVTNEPTRTSNP